jgi:gamma-glutamylcyclotransferase
VPPVWYFGYGSNMNRAIFHERRGMQPLATRCGWLEGHRLRFNIPIGPGERAVANLEPDPAARTCGVLYLLTDEDCDRLDRTEGVHMGFYKRTPVDVVTEDGDRIAAFTYCSALTCDGRKPSARYLGLLVEGARAHCLPAEYVQFLESHELAWDERIKQA